MLPSALVTDTERLPAFPVPEGWLEYAAWRGEQGTIRGRVLVRPGVVSRDLGNERHVLAYVPPSLSAGADRRYPVLYMHDGQNLFDVGTSDYGEWQIDETMEALGEDGIEAIVVAIPNAVAANPSVRAGRMLEYSPHRDDQGRGGNGDAYLRFLASTVKPLVDVSLPTRPESAATGIAGSSMGGLISLYAAAARPDVFGFAGVISPALWFADGRVLHEEMPRVRPGPRIYVDVGGREGEHEATAPSRATMSRRYVNDARLLRDQLIRNGFRPDEDLLYVEDPDALHHQSAWALRMPRMLRFLLGPAMRD